MKKLITVVSALLLSFGAFAESSFVANDCTAGLIEAGKKIIVKDFTINGAQKGGIIEDKGKSPIKNGDKVYSKRLQFKGADGFIEFDAKAGDVISVVATSVSKTDARAVRITNEGKKLADISAPAWNMASPSFSSESVTVLTDGKCRIKGMGGGVYIFEIEIRHGNI